MKGAKGSVSISADLTALLESGVSAVVGTRDADFVPEITRAWGLLVSKDRTSISLCVPLATSQKTLDNLAGNGQITVCCSLPTSYKTVQLKGQCIEIRDPRRADLAAVERHREAFGRLNVRIGFPRQRTETFWRREVETSPVLVNVRFLPEQIFDQTPGPDAGSPL
ncbi:MAG: hypothetical protein ACLQVG_04895 [Terriglobia bacterium]